MSPRILLLATGDTMAHHRRDGTPVVLTGADLLATAPAPAGTVDVDDLATGPSWDTTPATMLALARRVRTALLDDGHDAVVLTHGLDTVEETAYLTDLLLGPDLPGPVILTGARRRPYEPGADGPRNLAAALTAAADPTLRHAGVLVCADDDLHAARWVTAVDATGGPALRSDPYPVVARVADGRVEPVAAPPARPPHPPGQPATDVALIRTYPGIPAGVLTAAVDAGAAGLVLEGTGPGNVPVDLLTTIGDLTEWGIPVVVASRCRTRPVALADLPPPDGLAASVGAVGARGLPAGKARVALMVALGAGGAAAARDWFARL
ncbi:asparaginase [Micromonospora rosaria]